MHTHPGETIRDAISILREYGVSQMPVVKAEPPVTSGEVAGSVSERALLELLFTGQAHLADAVERHMERRAPARRVRRAGQRGPPRAAERGDAVLVTDEGKPVGVLTRADLLGFLSS